MKKTIINQNGEYCSGFFFKNEVFGDTIRFAEKHGDYYKVFWADDKELFLSVFKGRVETLVNNVDWKLCLPHEFSFALRDIPIKFTAASCVFDNHQYDLIEDCGDNKPRVTAAYFTEDDAIDRVISGKYILVNPYAPEYNTEKDNSTANTDENTTKTISININDVRCAAQFDIDNNLYTFRQGKSVEEIENEIIEMIEKLYHSLISGEKEWRLTYTATRSYMVIFQPEDENYGVISVLVDPSVGKTRYYASVEDFLNQS